MTIHTKSSLIVLGTLIIGIICGALLNGSLRMNRDGPFAGPPSPERFSGFFLDRIIRPDEEQREELQRIMADYRPKFEETMSRHRGEIATLIDSLEKQIDPMLTEEQRERLAERRDRGGRFFDRRRMRGRRPEGRQKPLGGRSANPE
jgi:hypothetical protein